MLLTDKAKLQDYLSGFKELRKSGSPIGAVLVPKKDRKTVAALLEKENFSILKIEGDPVLALKNLRQELTDGKEVAVDAPDQIPPLIQRELLAFRDGEFLRNGEEAKVVLVMSPEGYYELRLGDAISSVCRLG